jgi:hypothetical protein
MVHGGVAEWSKAAVLKTAVPATVPGVRIPSPPLETQLGVQDRSAPVVPGTAQASTDAIRLPPKPVDVHV